MKTILRFIISICLIVWLGGIFFFAINMAPNVFNVLSNVEGGTEYAGFIIAHSINGLHTMGLICGCVLLLASAILHKKVFRLENLLIIAMLLLTFASRNYITPRMESIRNSVARLDQLPANSDRRLEFDRLHVWSTRVEGSVLFFGFLVIGFESKREE